MNVLSNGNITANNVTANYNYGPSFSGGALLDNYPGTGGTVPLTGTNVFNNNDYCGLTVDSAGDINLNNITASNSVRSCGAQLGSDGNVTLTGTNFFNNNAYSFTFSIAADGNINLNNITASNNHFGVKLDNCNDWGSGCVGWGDVTLTGTNVFDDNQAWGLIVDSTGNIELNNVTANRNDTYGVKLDNSYGSGNVTVSGTNTLNDNGYDGLVAYSDGNVTLENLTANRNAYYGIYVGNFGDTTLTGVTASGNPVCNIFVNCECLDQDGPDLDPNPAPILSSPDFVDLVIDCSLDSSFLGKWASGDQVVLSCVDGGTARLWRMENTMLPVDMPAGFEYASGFLVEIFQDGIPLDVLTDEGFIQIGFASRHENPEYRIVYWDEGNGDWIPLKDIQQDAVGGSVSFPLHSSNPQDVYKVLRGVSLIVDGSRYREEVTTNFPGLFVLAQK